MIKKNLLITFIIFVSFLSHSNTIYALTTSTGAIVKAYDSFILKIEAKLDIKSQITLLEKLAVKLELTLKSKSLSTKSVLLLKELNNLNDLKLEELRSKLDQNYYIDLDQIKLEKEELQKLSTLKFTKTIPDYISSLKSFNRTFLYIEFSSDKPFFEFVDNEKIKRIIFKNYFEITDKNYDLFKSKSGYILHYNGKYIFVENYEIEEKVPYSNAGDYFKDVIFNPLLNFHLINGNYYSYTFSQFSFLEDKYGFYPKALSGIGYNTKDLILFKNSGKYTFVSEYKEQKLINSNIVTNIKNKKLFLGFITDDKKFLDKDTDKYFQDLKKITEDLTKGLSNDEKIKKIYDYVLKNVTYTNPIDLNRKEIFSGIDTFKNKDGVCEGYAKLMGYMLMFAGIEDIDVIRGFVINAQDFPNVGHAWLKIGTYYYDPTFDDPIGNTQAKTFENYDYFKLPADLFYTNRYDVGSIPEELKSKSKDELDAIVSSNLYNLVPKYKDSNYNLMKYTLMLYDNGLSYNDKITLSMLKSLLINYDVNGSEMSFVKDGKKYFFKKLKFYQITDQNIKEVLLAINYDLSGKFLLKWNFPDGTYEYRLSYELEVF